MACPSIYDSDLFGIPLVVSYQTNHPAHLRVYVLQWIRPVPDWMVWHSLPLVRLICLADLTLATSESMQQRLLGRCVVAHCAVWQNLIHPCSYNRTIRHQMTNGHDCHFILLCVARIAEEKPLECFRVVLDHFPEKSYNRPCRPCSVGTDPFLWTKQRIQDVSIPSFLG